MKSDTCGVMITFALGIIQWAAVFYVAYTIGASTSEHFKVVREIHYMIKNQTK